MRHANDRIYELHAALCKALAHPARIKALDILREGEECVCRLAPRVGVTESNLSQLLAALRRAGLVETRRKGHSVYYRVRDKRVFRVIDEMRGILTDQLTRAGGLAVPLQV